MSNEEYERIIEFILEQQAQFSANIQKHDERLARNEEIIGQVGERLDQLGERLDQLREHVAQLEDIVNRLAAATLAGFKDVNAKIDALLDSHIRLSDAQARTEANQARTDEALKNLIASLERYINERHNGEQKSDG